MVKKEKPTRRFVYYNLKYYFSAGYNRKTLVAFLADMTPAAREIICEQLERTTRRPLLRYKLVGDKTDIIKNSPYVIFCTSILGQSPRCGTKAMPYGSDPATRALPTGCVPHLCRIGGIATPESPCD